MSSLSAGDGTILLGDAAKVISRRLREQDSIYMLAPTCFCAVLPGADMPVADKLFQPASTKDWPTPQAPAIAFPSKWKLSIIQTTLPAPPNLSKPSCP